MSKLIIVIVLLLSSCKKDSEPVKICWECDVVKHNSAVHYLVSGCDDQKPTYFIDENGNDLSFSCRYK